MLQLIYTLPNTSLLVRRVARDEVAQDIIDVLTAKFGSLSLPDVVVRVNGRQQNLHATRSTDDTEELWFDQEWLDVAVSARLRGGKGGFGTLLKAQRGRKRKVKNFDACKTLEGGRYGKTRQAELLEQWKEKKEKEERLIELLGGEDVSLRTAKAAHSPSEEGLAAASPAFTRLRASKAPLKELNTALSHSLEGTAQAVAQATSSASPLALTVQRRNTSPPIPVAYLDDCLPDLDLGDDDGGENSDG